MSKKAVKNTDEPKLSDFFGILGSDPEWAKLSHKELKDLIMEERLRTKYFKYEYKNADEEK